MKTVSLQYTGTDPGFCRVNFKTLNIQGYTIRYCLMEDCPDVKLFRTSGGDYDEPMYSVKPWSEIKYEFETPPDEYGQELVRRYMKTLEEP